LLLALGGLTGACLDRPEDGLGDADSGYPPTSDDDDDDTTEDQWDDPIFNSDDDDSAPAVPNQIGIVSFSYNFEVNSEAYWDCQRRYRWIELPEVPATGCADCLTTWRITYQVAEDNCGEWGWNGDGYQLTAGLDPVKNWLWFTHDEGSNWLRFPGQGTILSDSFTASWTWDGDCFDVDSDGECDPGSEMSYRELFDLDL
jgi:hypothetical protein